MHVSPCNHQTGPAIQRNGAEFERNTQGDYNPATKPTLESVGSYTPNFVSFLNDGSEMGLETREILEKPEDANLTPSGMATKQAEKYKDEGNKYFKEVPTKACNST